MLSLLLVDDEINAVESMRSLIDWERYGFDRVEICFSAPEALSLMEREPVDVVITDIKMPVMTGLELIERSRAAGHNTEFIVLSGYDEFEFARSAMRYGIKHYLLKPCGEEMIGHALMGATKDLERRRGNMLDMETRQAMDLAIARQYVKLCLQGLTVNDFMADNMDNLFSGGTRLNYIGFRQEGAIPDLASVFACFQNLGGHDFALLEPVIKINDYLGALYFCKNTDITATGITMLQMQLSHVLGVLPQMIPPAVIHYKGLHEKLESICGKYEGYLRIDSKTTTYDKLYKAYQEEDVNSNIVQIMNAESKAVAEDMLLQLFSTCDRGFAVLVCTKLLMKRLLESGLDSGLLLGLFNRIYETDDVAVLARDLSGLVLRSRREDEDLRGENFVETILRYLEEHLDNPELSLKWIAKNLVFRNEDHVSKVFSKQIGSQFTNYLNGKRIERAKFLISTLGDDKLYTVAEQIGLGGNPNYFSKLFKRYTGYTPKEYRTLRRE